MNGRVVIMRIAWWLGAASTLISAELRLRVVGLTTNDGVARFEVYDSRAVYEKRAARWTGEVAPSSEVVYIELKNLSEQPCVVRVFHDENGNGKRDRSPLGAPEEPVGFSRNARARFGPPSFDEAAIDPRRADYEA